MMLKRKKGVVYGISPSNSENVNYACKECNCKIKESYVKCPECDGEILEYVNYNDWNYCLVRKYANEIEEGDNILLRIDGEYHRVLNIEELENNIYKIALKGYAVVKLDGDDFVKCGWGTWEVGTTPWEK